MSLDTHALAEAMRGHLLSLKRWRGEDREPVGGARIREVKRWQSDRLTRTYADLAAQGRYRKATAFFLEDLYGPKDFSDRDAAMLRILPVMARVLPAKAVETAALSIEVEALSEELDHRLAAALGEAALEEESYAAAYRASATREERMRQISLIVEVGHRLDALVHWPFIGRTLKLMRTPARLAGLSDLQDFLERGFEAFRLMGGAGEFLGTIERREGAILDRLFIARRPYFDVA
jgi:hypothetical protein